MTAPSTLSDHAPSLTLLPGEKPHPTAARAFLAREGVDAMNLDDLMRFAGRD